MVAREKDHFDVSRLEASLQQQRHVGTVDSRYVTRLQAQIELIGKLHFRKFHCTVQKPIPESSFPNRLQLSPQSQQAYKIPQIVTKGPGYTMEENRDEILANFQVSD